MKKTIVGAIIFIVLLLIMYFAFGELSEEQKLKSEIASINVILNKSPVDYAKLNEKLVSNVTTDDYLQVEKAVKSYLRDIYNNSMKLGKLLNDEKLEVLLSVQNYKEDGPDFKNTTAYIKDRREEFKTLKENCKDNFDDVEVMTYIDDKKLDDYYVDLYKELVLGGESDKEANEEVIADIDKMINLLNKQENVINFLIENKGKWEIRDDKIQFENEKLEKEYNSLIDKLDS